MGISQSFAVLIFSFSNAIHLQKQWISGRYRNLNTLHRIRKWIVRRCRNPIFRGGSTLWISEKCRNPTPACAGRGKRCVCVRVVFVDDIIQREHNCRLQ